MIVARDNQEFLWRTETTVRREDDNIPPKELSGDENEEKLVWN